ncbi:MAG: TolC family protein [Cyanobacteria bacterium]|nr:TolC family protein [Cyanobacteriota bacterium]
MRQALISFSLLLLTARPGVAQISIPADAQASTLAALVAEIDRNSPEIKAARREVDMRVARIQPAGAPPDPTISAGYMGGLLRPPFFPAATAPGSFRQFGLSQEIPFPGKLGLKSRVAGTEADAARWDYETTRRQLAAELKSAYVEYQYLSRSLDILVRNKERLDQFRQIAEARFSVGQGVQQDVLKAQVEISLILERQALFEQQRDSLRARINGLLFRQPDTPLDPALTFAVTPLMSPVEELRALLRQNYPALKRDERVIDRGQQALALARKELLPDFGVNVTTQKYVGGMPWMYGVDFMVKVPLFWQRKQRPMIAEAAAALEEGRQMRDATLSTASAKVTEEYLAGTTSYRLAELYNDSVLPQARLSLESSLASYQVGRVDFLNVLTNFVTVLSYEISYEEQHARYLQALARLEPLTGLSFIR